MDAAFRDRAGYFGHPRENSVINTNGDPRLKLKVAILLRGGAGNTTRFDRWNNVTDRVETMIYTTNGANQLTA